MTREEALKHYAEVKARVDTWPAWMRNLLRDRLEPALPEPRKPVIDWREIGREVARESKGKP